MTKERIEIIRQALIPFVKKELLDINYEGLGKSDAEEFEKDLNEILDLSIKALEQPTTKENLAVDCVSRQAVIDMTGLSNWFESSDDYCDFVSELCKLPPVTPTQRWIPVSERLPKPFEWVYATCKSNIDNRPNWVIDGCYMKWGGKEVWCGHIPMLESGDAEIIAWMPMNVPKAYEEKRGKKWEK